MKRIGASRNHTSQPRESSGTRIICPASEWTQGSSAEGLTDNWWPVSSKGAERPNEWRPLSANLFERAALQPARTGTLRQSWGEEIWPDCLD